MEINNWYSIGIVNEGVICSNCKMNNKVTGLIHTNDRRCPECNIKCIYFALDKINIIQIIPERAPEVFKKFIFWFQNELSEIEFVFFKGYIKKIVQDLDSHNSV